MHASTHLQRYTALHQLKACEKRIERIINFLKPHFGKEQIDEVLLKINPRLKKISPISKGKLTLEFIRVEANKIHFNEALILGALRTEIKSSIQNIDEQILFASRCAGQEAARQILANYESLHTGNLSLTEVVQAIKVLNFFGIEEDKDYFISLRPLSDATIHYNKCPALFAWIEACAEISLMKGVQEQWILGILDILAPNILYHSKYSIALGHPYGLDQLTTQHKHVI